MAKIAIIEDDNFLLGDLSFFVREAGHEVIALKNARTVLEEIESVGKCACIILDLMMVAPDGGLQFASEREETGEALYRLLRKRFPDLRIFVVTAKNVMDTTISFRREQNVRVFEKPLHEGDITRLIRALVE